jgi:predicted unusual protein kinase regulating ubiquinone biosynthesis (AarF/ABC1/UbiB family)
MQYFMREYRDIVYEAPFQFPVDMLFTFRAIGILSGMATNLDPNFDPWAEGIPFAERLAREELQKNWRGWLEDAIGLGQLLLKLPSQFERILTDTERGNLVIQNALTPAARRTIKSLEQAINRLTWMVLAVGLLISGINLYTSPGQEQLGLWLLATALVVLLWSLFKR